MNFIRSIFVIAIAALVTACAGGGGGSGASSASTPITVVPLTTTWQAAKAPNTQVTANALSANSTYSSGSGGASSVSKSAFGTGAATGAITYNSAGEITAVSVTYDGKSHNWSSSNSTYVTESDYTIGISSEGNSTRGLFSNPTSDASSWNYQVFGYWLTGYGSGSGELGAHSFGLETVGADIPSSGNASFDGAVAGTYIDATGELHTVRSTINLSANFASRQVSLATTNTYVKDLATGTLQEKASLNLTGTLIYSAGTNYLISTSLTTTGGLSGAAQAQFYGPNAEEIGGVFSLSGTSPESYQGAFGAKQ